MIFSSHELAASTVFSSPLLPLLPTSKLTSILLVAVMRAPDLAGEIVQVNVIEL